MIFPASLTDYVTQRIKGAGAALRADAYLRDRNTVVAVHLVKMLERHPAHWEAMRSRNLTAKAGERQDAPGQTPDRDWLTDVSELFARRCVENVIGRVCQAIAPAFAKAHVEPVFRERTRSGAGLRHGTVKDLFGESTIEAATSTPFADPVGNLEAVESVRERQAGQEQ